MRSLRRHFATFVIALAPLVTVGRVGVARADAGAVTTLAVARPRNAPRLSIDGPKSSLHLEVDGMCEPHRDDGGANGATCPVLDFQTGDLKDVAVVMGDGYSVDIVIEDERIGTGEERARRAVAELCTSIPPGPRVVVAFADRRFVRAQSPDASGICFVTADERPEVAAIVFRALDGDSMLHVVHPEFVLDLAQEADMVMGTLRVPTKSPAPTTTGVPATAPARAGAGSGDLVVILIVLAVGSFGLLGFVKRSAIARLLGLKRGSEKRVEEPGASRGPRNGPQLAGSKCTACKRNIVSERAAVHCLECALPLHKVCLGRHTSVAHGPPPRAYR